MIVPKSIAESNESAVNLPLAIKGWNPVTPFLTDLVSSLQPRNILEVGSWTGFSAQHWLSHSDANLYCLDTWLGALEFYTDPTPERDLKLVGGYPSIYYQFVANMQHLDFAHRVYPIPLPSELGFKLLKKLDIVFDFAYIDGSHEEEDVYDDVHSALFMLNCKVVAGDDYDNIWPGVKSAVNTLLANHAGEGLRFYDNGREWYILKEE